MSKSNKTTCKQRNYVAKYAHATTSGAGVHRDRKKDDKRGYQKHKKSFI